MAFSSPFVCCSRPLSHVAVRKCGQRHPFLLHQQHPCPAASSETISSRPSRRCTTTRSTPSTRCASAATRTSTSGLKRRPVKQDLVQMVDVLVKEENALGKKKADSREEKEEKGSCMNYLIQNHVIDTLCGVAMIDNPPGLHRVGRLHAHETLQGGEISAAVL